MEYKFNNFYELITFQAKKRRSKVALLVDNEKITYGDILEKADKLAGFLAGKGVKEGDRIALFLRNSPEFIYTIFAASKLGAILVPVNTFLKEEELSYILEDSGSAVLVASTVHDKVVNSSKASSLCQFILWEGEELAEGKQ
ncbi:MAG TPA: long-chain fatty acid--CoA ligase, partial [Epsilonproteobacteria bacterium]|nr:long-chain fatty acid--CoA ligase [Campylobacterota bacterium]